MAEEDSHGYDVEFLAPPPFDTLCAICQCTFRAPVQVRECGHIFCNNCIKTLKRRVFILRCPLCEGKAENTFPDKNMERMVLNLDVKCTHNSNGCEWTGPLRKLVEHLTDCGYMETACTNNNCQTSLERRHLADHFQVCQHRTVKCTHCSEDYIFLTKVVHERKDCKKLPLNCPNSCGHIIPSDEMDKHVKEECKNTIHHCKYINIGCEAKGTRSWLEEHEETDTKIHLSQAVEKLKDHEEHIRLSNIHSSQAIAKQKAYEERFSEQSNQIECLHYLLKSRKPHQKPFVYTMKDFQEKFESAKVENDLICTEPFYCLEGYRSRMDIYLNGWSTGLDTHISVAFRIMKGPFDNSLNWPFKGIIKYSVKGKKANDDIVLEFDATKEQKDNIKKCFQKPTTEHNFSRGNSEFVSHERIYRYVMDDTLTITCDVRPAE